MDIRKIAEDAAESILGARAGSFEYVVIEQAIRRVLPPPGHVLLPDGRCVKVLGPEAWIVDCPAGHEFDALVFTSEDEADVSADQFNDDYPEGESPHKAAPLYRFDDTEAADAARLAAEGDRPPYPLTTGDKNKEMV